MLKIYMTGDNHFGRSYNHYSNISNELIESRFHTFEKMIHQAENEHCDLFVVTGDLFDKTTVAKKTVIKVTQILSQFNGTVLVLPGNHDFYTGEENCWKFFKEAQGANTILLNEFKVYTLNINDQPVNIYPAYCQQKHSDTNNLGWIKQTHINEQEINIGIAHGSIEGISPDMKNEYFLMSPNELNNIPVNVWLIGHTHIQYPELSDTFTNGHKIFNAGTHEQLDLHNNTEGVAFIITIEDDHQVASKKIQAGEIHYYDLMIHVNKNLKEALHASLYNIDSKSVVRVKVDGIVEKEELQQLSDINSQYMKQFMDFELIYSDLSEEITMASIQEEFSELSFAAQFLMAFKDNPKELEMAYKLVEECID